MTKLQNEKSNNSNWTKDPYWKVWNLLYARVNPIWLLVLDGISSLIIYFICKTYSQLKFEDVFILGFDSGIILLTIILILGFRNQIKERFLWLPSVEDFIGFFSGTIQPIISYNQVFWVFNKKWLKITRWILGLSFASITGLGLLLGNLFKLLPVFGNFLGGVFVGLLFTATIICVLFYNSVYLIIYFKYSLASGIRIGEIYSKKTDELIKLHIVK